VTAIAYYFAVVSHISLVALLLASYGAVAQIFPILIATFYWPRATRAGVLAALIGSVAVSTLFLVFPDWRPLPMHAGIYGLLVNVVLLVTVSLKTEPVSSVRLAPYLQPGWD
jgi:SSS family solute:Na+ symporter